MNKRRITFEVTVDGTPDAPNAIAIMTAVFNGLSAARLNTEIRVLLLEDKSVFEGVVPKGGTV